MGGRTYGDRCAPESLDRRSAPGTGEYRDDQDSEQNEKQELRDDNSTTDRDDQQDEK
jgi:hypothetical protein